MPRSPRLAHKARPVMQATLNQFSNVIQSTLALWTPPYYGHIGNMGSSSITRQNELQVNFFSNLNPCPSLPSVATDNRKQFQCINIVLNNKTVSLFLEFNWLEDTFYLFWQDMAPFKNPYPRSQGCLQYWNLTVNWSLPSVLPFIYSANQLVAYICIHSWNQSNNVRLHALVYT